MRTIRQRSLSIPTDDDGMLGRECPRCRGRFQIDLEYYESRGYMNLRCPYCRFISELDNFTTGEQRAYIYSTTRNMAFQAAEEAFEEAFEGISGSSSGSVEFSVDAGDIDFGRVQTESPEFTTEVSDVECEECGFSFRIKPDSEGVCPVCR